MLKNIKINIKELKITSNSFKIIKFKYIRLKNI